METTAEEMVWDVVVVGGGPAGLSAALMLVRARRRVLVVDGGAPRNRFAAHMHGVLGHDGRSPLALLADGRREVESYGGVIRSGLVSAAERSGAGFRLTLEDGAVLSTRRLIMATGVRDELPRVEGLAEQWGRGVIVCPYCDGYEVRDARIGVLATGPFGLHQVQLVRQWSSDLTYFVHSTDMPTGDELVGLLARGIVVEPTPVASVLSAEGRLAGVVLVDGRQVALDSLFVGPTPVPLDTMARQLGATVADTPFGPLVAVDQFGASSVAGLWVVGNASNLQANVPVAMAAGSSAGAAVNADLVLTDIADAVALTRTPAASGH